MENFDLTHLGYTNGKMGRMLGTMCIKTLPGDTFDISSSILINMAPYRRQIYLDARVDIATFYIPDRYHYSNLIDMIEDGVDTAETLSVDTYNSLTNLYFLPHWTTLPTSKPDWYTQGPLDIYNRFYRPKTSFADPGAGDITYSSVGWGTGSWLPDDLEYGPPVAKLPTAIWNSSVNRDLEDADFDIDSSGSTIDITEIYKQKARLKSERKRQFYSYWYEQIIKDMGGSSTMDAEPRPEMIWHDTQYISGENIRGTDNQTLGAIVGKGGGKITHRIPKKYIREHGTIFTFITIRFPEISVDETQYLIRNGAGTYKTLIGDTDIVEAEPPFDLQLDDIFDTSATTTIQKLPYGQWYRMHPSFASQKFKDQFGFTFAQGVPSTDIGENYYNYSISDENFQSQQFGHFMLSIKNNVFVDRHYPSASKSIFAGTN